MDTLCIPVHSSKLAKSCRKKAIQLLGETFHEATAVLVIDRELEIVQSATAPFLELGLRILCSGWMKRLWTLQEAALASEARGVAKLYFQMRDGPFLYQNDLNSPEKRTAPIHDEEGSLLHEGGIEVRLWMAIPSVRSLREVPEGYSPFRFIHDAIEHRSTSKFERCAALPCLFAGQRPNHNCVYFGCRTENGEPLHAHARSSNWNAVV